MFSSNKKFINLTEGYSALITYDNKGIDTS